MMSGDSMMSGTAHEFTPGLRLRSYRPTDLDAIYQLDVVCFDARFRFSRRAMKRFAEAEEAVTCVAEVGATVVGFGIAEVAERAGYIVTLDVHPDWRHKGIGKSILSHIEDSSRHRGATLIMLHVYGANTAATQLYAATGFQRVGTVEDFYGPGLDAIVYQKSL